MRTGHGLAARIVPASPSPSGISISATETMFVRVSRVTDSWVVRLPDNGKITWATVMLLVGAAPRSQAARRPR